MGIVLSVHTSSLWLLSLSHQTFSRCLKAALVVLLRKGFRLAWNLGVFAGNVQLLRTVHTAHGRVDGIPRVRRVYHRLEKEFAMAYAPGVLLGVSPRHQVELPCPRRDGPTWNRH